MDEITISTKTIEEWKQVVKTAQDNGYRWKGGRKGLLIKNWYEYKEDSCIFLIRNDITYGGTNCFPVFNIVDIITAQEYLTKYGSGEKIKDNVIAFQKRYNHISPRDLADIIEDFEEMGYLTEKGNVFSCKFWEAFIIERTI